MKVKPSNSVCVQISSGPHLPQKNKLLKRYISLVDVVLAELEGKKGRKNSLTTLFLSASSRCRGPEERRFAQPGTLESWEFKKSSWKWAGPLVVDFKGTHFKRRVLPFGVRATMHKVV